MMKKTNTPDNPTLPAQFHAALHQWYARNGRHTLPWRIKNCPYEVYISEIMLQQTQVATVLARFYYPFLKRFPTLKTLADASEEEVLKAWQGLGYYSRARNLHRAAQLCGSTLPATIDALQALPGIGKNTAHAVACFGFNVAAPVMEANVKRVLHRIYACARMSDTELWDAAWGLLDRENPYDYNQAMMDIGAQICTPRAPKCLLCPASVICQGKDNPEAYPAPKAKKAVPVRKQDIIVAMDASGRVYAVPRETKLLQGMYQFCHPGHPILNVIPTERSDEGSTQAATGEDPSASLGMTKLGEVSHEYSHFRLEADVYLAPHPGGVSNWFTLEEFAALPHTRTEAKILKLLLSRPCAPTRPPARSPRGRRVLSPSAT